MAYLFSFAAKGLQSFVLEGDQLKTMAGATELIDRLCRTDFLTKLLGAAGIPGKIQQGAAGAARILIEDESDARRLAAVWPVFCGRWAPGLEVVQSLCEIAEDDSTAVIGKAEEEMRLARNFLPPDLPLANPLMERCRRTGRAACGVDDTEDSHTPVDAATLRKLSERNRMRGKKQETDSKKEVTALMRIFGFADPTEIPESFDQISGSERGYLAVIHADGNGLGKLFMKLAETAKETGLGDHAQAVFEAVSRTVVENATRLAVEEAVKEMPWKEGQVKPWLPIVLAGDDVTLVCRADLAWTFASAFVRKFREKTAAALTQVKADVSLDTALTETLPDCLTAGAGIAYVSAHYPFSLGYALAEALAGQAKTVAKQRTTANAPVPGSIHFFRVTGSSAPTDYDSLSRNHAVGR